jgi:hypothetical protein
MNAARLIEDFTLRPPTTFNQAAQVLQKRRQEETLTEPASQKINMRKQLQNRKHTHTHPQRRELSDIN